MNANMLTRLNRFAAHASDLPTPPGGRRSSPATATARRPGS